MTAPAIHEAPERLRLDGRVALVTGGTAGIGAAIAREFLAAGARVVVNGRNRQRWKGLEAALPPDLAARAGFVAGDVTRREDCDRLVRGVLDEHGRLDVLVNNAGGSDPVPTPQMTDEQWDLAMNWNVNATFWCTRAALPHMIERRSGRIVNISSIEGKLQGYPGMAAYVAAKHAVNGFTKSVAREVGPFGITVNAICPGLVLTDIVRERAPQQAATMGITVEQLYGLFERDAALQRLVEPEEVAALALLLATPAGAGITGAQITVDAGISPY